MPRNVIIVSPYFPPSALAGVHRARLLARHLPSFGWNPIILCVDERFYEQRLDLGLARLVSESVSVVKVCALPIRFTRPLGLGDITLRSFYQLRSKLIELMSTRNIDSVLMTAAPYFHLMLAPMLKRRFGAQVVLDFQDPWVSQWGAAQPKLSKSGIMHHLAEFLEPVAVRVADQVISVSELQNEEMRQRYSWLEKERMHAIPIGGDPEDFQALARAGGRSDLFTGREGQVELSYVGSYWPAAEQPIRAFLRGVARLKREAPDVLARLRINFVGTDPTFSGARKEVTALAETEGVAEFINEFPTRMAYLDALKVTVQSDGLILIGSDEPHYTASKIYTALMSQRPYISLFHHESSAHSILSKAGGGVALSFKDRMHLQHLDAEIASALKILAFAPGTVGKADPAIYSAYEAKSIASRFADIFDQGQNLDRNFHPHI